METWEECMKSVQSQSELCELWTDFTHSSGASVVDFELVNVSLVCKIQPISYIT